MGNAPLRGCSLLAATALSLGLGTSVGCLRHEAHRQSASYRLQSLSNVTVLQPPGLADINGTSQTTVVRLGPATGGAPTRDGACTIPGKLFALSRTDREDLWRITSPSADGWNTDSVQVEVEHEWSHFTNALAAMIVDGCFPAGVSLFSIQHQLVEAIPVPANMVLRYYYSLTSTGFVDLQPGMQLGIETLNAAAPGTSQTLHFAVVDRPPTGVALEAVNVRHTKRTGEQARFSTLPETFAATPFLRVFLERIGAGPDEARDAMLLGAKTVADMDGATAAIVRGGVSSCAGTQAATLCLVFAGSGVSLLTEIMVNGHVMFYAPGTTLSQVVDPVPEPRRAKALATVTVRRRAAGGLVPVDLPRTEEGRFNLILLNGDQIRWRQ